METEITLTLNKDMLFKLIKEIRELKNRLPRDKDNIVRLHRLTIQERVLNNILTYANSYLEKELDNIRNEREREMLRDELLT